MTEKPSYFNKDLLNNGINLDDKISSIYDDIGYARPVTFDHTGHDDALELVSKHTEIFLKHVFASDETVYQRLFDAYRQEDIFAQGILLKLIEIEEDWSSYKETPETIKSWIYEQLEFLMSKPSYLDSHLINNSLNLDDNLYKELYYAYRQYIDSSLYYAYRQYNDSYDENIKDNMNTLFNQLEERERWDQYRESSHYIRRIITGNFDTVSYKQI